MLSRSLCFFIGLGVNVHFVYEMTRSMTQPMLEDYLNDTFDLYDPALIPLIHQESFVPNLVTLTTSQAVVETILSPLKIAQTRMVVQSSGPLKRYATSFHALYALWQEGQDGIVGRLRGLYPNFRFTLFCNTIIPLMENMSPLIIHR
jgi:hypothetical protein